MVRKILTILFISIALFSCKPTQLSFSPAQMNITHVKNMFATDKNYDTSKIKSGKIIYQKTISIGMVLQKKQL